MRGALGGPRVLLRRLREVMAEPVSAQERLDKIVVLIAANMVAEVCSVYVLRVDGTLELYASEGLKPEAVHQTVLRPDEGLVGLVASEANPINLSQAQDHPAFSFRPETGEEIYHAFLGVPVLRAGNMLGVLVVQNRARPHLHGRRRRGAADHRDGARRDDRFGRTLGHRQARPRTGGPAAAASERRRAQRRHRARSRRPARAAGGDHQFHRRRHPEGAETARSRDRHHALRPRRAARARRSRRRRRAPGRAGSLPDVRLRPGLGAPARRGGEDRPDRRGGGRARAIRHPCADAAHHRSLPARTAARLRRPRQPADAPAQRPGTRADPRTAPGERRPGRALDGPRGAARLRPPAPARTDPRGRRPDLARRDRRARARHRGGRRDCQCDRHCGPGRCRHRRRRHRRCAHPPVARHGGRLYRAGAAAGAAADAVPRAARQALRHQGRREGDADDQCGTRGRPAAHRGNRRRRHRAVPHRAAVHGGGGVPAHRRAVHALSRACSTPPAKSR